MPVKATATPSTPPRSSRTPEPASKHRVTVGSPLKNSTRADSPAPMPMPATPPASGSLQHTSLPPVTDRLASLPPPAAGLAPAAPIVSAPRPSSSIRADFALTIDPATGKALVHASIPANRPTMPTLHAAEVASVGRILASREVLVNRFGAQLADVLIARGSRALNGRELPALPHDPDAERAAIQRTLSWAVVGKEDGEEEVPRDATWLTPPTKWMRAIDGSDDEGEAAVRGGQTVGLGIGAGKSVRRLTAQQRALERGERPAPSSTVKASAAEAQFVPVRGARKGQNHAHFALPPTPESEDWPRHHRQRTPSMPGSNPFSHPTLVPGDSYHHGPRYAYDGIEGVALAPSPTTASIAQWHTTPGPYATGTNWHASPQMSPARRQRVVSSTNLWDYPGLATPAMSAHDFSHDPAAFDASRPPMDGLSTPSRYGAYHRREPTVPSMPAQAAAYGLQTPAASASLGVGKWSGSRQRGPSAFWEQMNEPGPGDGDSPSHYLAASTHRPHHRRTSSIGGLYGGQSQLHLWDSPSQPHAAVATSMARTGSGLGIGFGQSGGDDMNGACA